MIPKLTCILTGVVEIAAADAYAFKLLCKARECAEIYILAAKRQRGCDGMGELAMIKEEFSEAIDGLIKYCKGKELLSKDLEYDLDSVAAELSSMYFIK